MSEQNAKTLSISFRVDDGIVEHNNREFIANNVDAGRVQDNITYCKRDIREMYKELFGQALEEYNAKQKRSDRKITDYYEHAKKLGHVKPFNAREDCKLTRSVDKRTAMRQSSTL